MVWVPPESSNVAGLWIGPNIMIPQLGQSLMAMTTHSAPDRPRSDTNLVGIIRCYCLPPRSDGASRRIYGAVINGIRCARNGNSALSMQLFDDAILLNPQSAAAHLCLGLRLLAEGLAKRALNEFSKALTLTKSIFCQTRILRCRGLLYHSSCELNLALVEFDRAIELDPAFADAIYLRGLIRYDQKQFDACVQSMTRSIELAPDSPAAYMNRGNAYKELAEYELAIRDLTAAIHYDDCTAVIYYNRGNVYCITRDLELAVSDYTKSIELDQNQASAYFNRGNTYHELGKFQLAINDFTEAVNLDPDDAARFLESRGCSFCRLEQLEEAHADFTRAAGLSPQAFTVFLNRSIVLFRQGRIHDALTDLDHCLELNPTCAMALKKRSDIFARVQQWRLLYDDFNRSISLHSKFAYASFTRGRCELKLAMLFSAAINDFKTAIEFRHRFVRYFERAEALSSDIVQKFAVAILDYTAAIKLEPSDNWAYIGRARAARGLQQHCRVLLDCNRALLFEQNLL